MNFIQDVTTSDHSGLAQNQARFKVYGNNMDKSISMVVFKEIEDSDMEKFAPDIFVIGGKKYGYVKDGSVSINPGSILVSDSRNNSTIDVTFNSSKDENYKIYFGYGINKDTIMNNKGNLNPNDGTYVGCDYSYKAKNTEGTEDAVENAEISSFNSVSSSPVKSKNGNYTVHISGKGINKNNLSFSIKKLHGEYGGYEPVNDLRYSTSGLSDDGSGGYITFQIPDNNLKNRIYYKISAKLNNNAVALPALSFTQEGNEVSGGNTGTTFPEIIPQATFESFNINKRLFGYEGGDVEVRINGRNLTKDNFNLKIFESDSLSELISIKKTVKYDDNGATIRFTLPDNSGDKAKSYRLGMKINSSSKSLKDGITKVDNSVITVLGRGQKDDSPYMSSMNIISGNGNSINTDGSRVSREYEFNASDSSKKTEIAVYGANLVDGVSKFKFVDSDGVE